MKRNHRFVSLALTFFVLTSIFTISANAASRELKTGIGFVTASSLRLRAGASSSTTTLDYASQNEVVVILGRTGSWYKVNYDLQIGYMHSDYLKVLPREDAELGYGRVNGNGVNVRSGPSTSYSKIAVANLGDKPYIIGINDSWFKVIFGTKIGYIRSDFVDLTEVPYENNASRKSPLFFRGGKSTGLAPSADALNGNTTNTTADQLIATAKKYIGVPYLWGGTTPSGFDCSGFLQYVFRQNGLSLLRTSKEQYTMGVYVAKNQLQKGDLVFFQTGSNGISHVGMYIGNDQFIHASSSNGVTISNLSNSYWIRTYYGARRVL